jgi:hypothetical protein
MESANTVPKPLGRITHRSNITEIHNIIICGLGGSGIGAKIVANCTPQFLQQLYRYITSVASVRSTKYFSARLMLHPVQKQRVALATHSVAYHPHKTKGNY